MKKLLENNYKELSNKDTIRKASSILLKLGFKFNHVTEGDKLVGYKTVLTLYYTETPVITLYSGGITEDTSIASAYTKIIARLLSIDYGVNEEALSLYDRDELGLHEFIIATDEHHVENVDKYLADTIMEFRKYSKGKPTESFIDDFLRMHTESVYKSYGCVPLERYTSAITGEDVYINEILHQGILEGIQSTYSGNSKYEVLVEGLSEIIEKRVRYLLYKNPVSMLIIPRENLPEYAKVLEWDFEMSGRFKLEIRDASLGKGFPVICAILYDKIRRGYFISFGSFPVMDIAINKAVNNMMILSRNGNVMNTFKSYEPNNFIYKYMRRIDGEDIDVKEYYDAQNMQLSNIGIYKDKIFGDDYAYEFKNWGINQLKSNEELFVDMVKLVKTEINTDIVYKDKSFLGMTTYAIICPEMYIEQFVGINKIYTALVQDRGCVEEFIYGGMNDLDKFTSEYFSLPNMTNLNQLLGRPVKYKGFLLPYLDGYVEFVKGNYEESSRIMSQKELIFEGVTEEDRFRILDILYCLENYIGLKASVKNEQEIQGILSKFYSEDIVNVVVESCRDYKTLATALFIDPKSELCLVDWDRYEINKEIIKKLRKKKKEYFND